MLTCLGVLSLLLSSASLATSGVYPPDEPPASGALRFRLRIYMDDYVCPALYTDTIFADDVVCDAEQACESYATLYGCTPKLYVGPEIPGIVGHSECWDRSVDGDLYGAMLAVDLDPCESMDIYWDTTSDASACYWEICGCACHDCE